MLWVAAAAPIALANRYQVELKWGLGHIPVFIEDFGVGLAVVSAMAFALPRLARWREAAIVVLLLFAGGLGVAAAITAQANSVLADSMQPGKHQRHLLERMVKAGLLANVPQEATVHDTITPGNYYLPAFYYQQDHRRYTGVSTPPADWAALSAQLKTPCDRQDPKSGAYWIAGIATPPEGPDATSVLCLGRPVPGSDRVFMQRLKHDQPILLSANRAARDGRVTGFAKLASELRTTSPGDGELLVDLPTGPAPIDPASLALNPAPTLQTLSWTGGCFAPPGSPTATCGRGGQVTVVNPTGAPVRLTLSAPMTAVAPAGAEVTFGGHTARVKGKPRTLKTQVTLAPRTTRTLELSATGKGVAVTGAVQTAP